MCSFLFECCEIVCFEGRHSSGDSVVGSLCVCFPGGSLYHVCCVCILIISGYYLLVNL